MKTDLLTNRWHEMNEKEKQGYGESNPGLMTENHSS